jgi:hypothetical protein
MGRGAKGLTGGPAPTFSTPFASKPARIYLLRIAPLQVDFFTTRRKLFLGRPKREKVKRAKGYKFLAGRNPLLSER